MYLVISFEDLREGEIGYVVGHMMKLYAYGHDLYCSELDIYGNWGSQACFRVNPNLRVLPPS